MSALNLLCGYGSDDTSDDSDKDNSIPLKKYVSKYVYSLSIV